MEILADCARQRELPIYSLPLRVFPILLQKRIINISRSRPIRVPWSLLNYPALIIYHYPFHPKRFNSPNTISTGPSALIRQGGPGVMQDSKATHTV